MLESYPGTTAEPTPPRRLPFVYHSVALLFVVVALVGFATAYATMSGVSYLVAILDLAVGLGLLMRMHFFWTVALFLIWLDTILLTFGLLVSLSLVFVSGMLLTAILGSLVTLARIAMNLCVYQVLIRPDVCACYNDPDQAT